MSGPGIRPPRNGCAPVLRAATPQRSRATRFAFVAIAASVLTILTVGGLVLIKGPPAAQAQTQPGPGLATQPPVPAAEPAKPALVDLPPAEEERVEPQDVAPADEAPAPDAQAE